MILVFTQKWKTIFLDGNEFNKSIILTQNIHSPLREKTTNLSVRKTMTKPAGGYGNALLSILRPFLVYIELGSHRRDCVDFGKLNLTFTYDIITFFMHCLHLA